MKKYSGIRGKLDDLVGGYFRSRPCDKCGKKESVQIQWAHIKSRKYLSVRWLTINSFSLCAGCHRWSHNQPELFTRWIDENYPGRIDELQGVFISNVGTLKSWWFEELYEKLKDELL